MLENAEQELHEQTILIVEAEGGARQTSLKDALTTEGYRVRSAGSVFEAMEEVMDFTGGALPDLILMDMDGFLEDELSILGSLGAKPGWQQIPRVALSASETNDTNESLRSMGCDKFVGKPIRADQLKRVVNSLLSCRAISAHA